MIKLKVSATASLYKDWVTKRQLSMEVQISRTLNKGKYVILLVLVELSYYITEGRTGRRFLNDYTDVICKTAYGGERARGKRKVGKNVISQYVRFY